MAELSRYVPELEVDKARQFMRYLVRAHERVTERYVAREALAAKLNAIRKFGPAKLRQELDQLEGAISDALTKERKLRASHKQEDFLHGQLRSKLSVLEQRVEKVIGGEETRARRIREIEQKIRGAVGLRVSKLQRLRDQIRRMERMHAALQEAGADAPRLDALKVKLGQLHDRLDELTARGGEEW